jgi:hypothetical protein
VRPDPPAAPPRPDERPRELQAVSWLTILGAVTIAAVAIAFFPRSGGDAPPLAALALIGAVVTAVTTAALYAIVRRDLGVPRANAIAFAIAFVLIGVVKFVLAPFGLYEVNAVQALDALVGTVGDVGGATLTAGVVFGLYALVYAVVFRFTHPRPGGRSIDARTILVVLVVLGALAVSGIGLVALMLLTAPRQYLEFVFSSGVGLLVGGALAGAALLIGSAFRRLGRRPDLVVDVGAVLTLFWLGLGFLALFHVLWLVYILVLGSIWPLRTVVPK